MSPTPSCAQKYPATTEKRGVNGAVHVHFLACTPRNAYTSRSGISWNLPLINQLENYAQPHDSHVTIGHAGHLLLIQRISHQKPSYTSRSDTLTHLPTTGRVLHHYRNAHCRLRSVSVKNSRHKMIAACAAFAGGLRWVLPGTTQRWSQTRRERRLTRDFRASRSATANSRARIERYPHTRTTARVRNRLRN